MAIHIGSYGVSATAWRWAWPRLLGFGVLLLVLALLVQFTFPGLEAVSDRRRSAVPMIRVPAGGTVTAEFESFCLDHHRGSPRSGSAYSMMGKNAGQLRPYMGQIFNEYLSHPSRWKQGDVQAAIWYCEGETNWESLTPPQRQLVETATGQKDPAHKHPLILINTLYDRLSPQRLLQPGIELLIAVMLAAFLATSRPSGLIASLFQWVGATELASRLKAHRYASRIDDVARMRELGTVRDQLDRLLRLAHSRVSEWRQGKGRAS